MNVANSTVTNSGVTDLYTEDGGVISGRETATYGTTNYDDNPFTNALLAKLNSLS